MTPDEKEVDSKEQFYARFPNAVWPDSMSDGEWHSALENIGELLAEIALLRAALKPFEIAAKDADGYPDNHPIGCDPCYRLDGLTVGSLRKALRVSEQQNALILDHHPNE